MQQNNKMIKVFIALSLTIILCLSFQPCQPFGTRLFYGNVIINPKAQEKLQVYFNTISQCSQSQVVLITKTGQKSLQCTITSLHLSQNTSNYKTFIHKCLTSEIRFQEEFVYNVYGWDGVSEKIPFSKTPISVKIADITNANRKINLIILADWSALFINADRYVKLDKLFAKITQQKQINGLVVNGDIGYDLDTNNCLNYQRFLVMISDIAKKIPVIMITGNRQYNTNDNLQLYLNSFQLNGLDKQLAVNLYLGNFVLLAFDPFQLLINSVSKDPTIDKFLAALRIAKNTGKYVVPISHYPLACSGARFCIKDRDIMKEYWNAMFQGKISLYFGAHFHTYQRIYPYLPDGSFSHQADGYRSDQNYIISIVEGVAGNDRDIVQSIDKIQPFTVTYTVNDTGFGVLSIDTKAAVYEHYSTSKGLFDTISIALIKSKMFMQE